MNSKMTLALLLLLACCASLSQGATLRTELRCQCIKTHSKRFDTRQIANIELIPAGAHCSNVEVIATLKTGTQVCLDPEAKWVKTIILTILNRASNKKSGTEGDWKP